MSIRTIGDWLRSWLRRWGRWLDKALSEPPMDEKDAKRRYEADSIFQPRDF